jgi:putative transposase
MPWKESQALEQRNSFITEWSKGEQSITELSRSFEISRKTAYKWLERFELTGKSGTGEHEPGTAP